MLKFCLFVSAVAAVFGKHIPPCEQTDKFNDYSIVMFQELIKTSGENLVLSALATGKLLALLSLGAKGDTASQIKDVLNLIGSNRDIRNWFRGLALERIALKNATVNDAFGIFLAECVAIDADFQKMAKDYLFTDVENINFYDPEQTALDINRWIEKKTHGKIKDLINEININPLTRSILVSTLYFIGEFQYPFPISATRKMDFCSSKTESSKVDMMTISGNYLISKHPDLGASMIYIPYKNQRIKLLIILPDNIEKAEYVQNNVLAIWHSRNFSQSHVQIFLPRFKIESTISMKPVLQKMGITYLFSKPDLSGITRDDVVLSGVFQKSSIYVNEIGTDAGAVTAGSTEHVALTLPGHKVQPHIFKVDIPFVYAILFDGLGILAGRVNKL